MKKLQDELIFLGFLDGINHGDPKQITRDQAIASDIFITIRMERHKDNENKTIHCPSEVVYVNRLMPCSFKLPFGKGMLPTVLLFFRLYDILGNKKSFSKIETQQCELFEMETDQWLLDFQGQKSEDYVKECNEKGKVPISIPEFYKSGRMKVDKCRCGSTAAFYNSEALQFHCVKCYRVHPEITSLRPEMKFDNI